MLIDCKNIYKANTESLWIIFRLIMSTIFRAVLYVMISIIYFLTYEPHSDCVVTERKVRRIRELTRFKLWFYRHFPKLCEIFLIDDYMKGLDNKFKHGV